MNFSQNSEFIELAKDFKDDYKLNHPDINDAKKIEEHFQLFDIFRIRNRQTITLILAGAKSIATNLGQFTMEEAHNILGYMNKHNRDKVLSELIKSGWIVSDGFYCRMPGRVRSLLIHIFASLARGELSTAEEIKLITFEAELSENYGLTDDEATANTTMALRQLSYWEKALEQILQRRSRKEVARIAEESKEIRNAIKTVKDKISKKQSLFSSSGYDDFFDTTSLLIDHFTRILQLAVQHSREDGKAMGKYISMEMIEEVINEASVEALASFTQKNFSASRQVLQLREETLQSRTKAFFLNQKEAIEDTSPPDPVDIIEEEMVVGSEQNALEIFHQEILLKMSGKSRAPMDRIIFEPNQHFGTAMYRTGQLIKLTSELKEREVSHTLKETLILDVTDNFIELSEGPIEVVSECYIGRQKNGTPGNQNKP
ncbi:hypothetical protein [Desulfitobacterium hafniense]|uniref:hypothetical protein n=1 Tax=Desulfitobacterium hafniense TaxID=49338 RepID=UPI0002FC30B2|nr:hypothetical protein [Desulfitobacterium hafniense]